MSTTYSEYQNFGSLLNLSKSIITKLETSDWLDRILLGLGFLFFLTVVIYIIKKRTWDVGISWATWLMGKGGSKAAKAAKAAQSASQALSQTATQAAAQATSSIVDSMQTSATESSSTTTSATIMSEVSSTLSSLVEKATSIVEQATSILNDEL